MQPKTQICRCNSVVPFLPRSAPQNFNTGFSFVVLPVYYHRVDGHSFEYLRFARQRIREKIQKKLLPEKYHSFMKIPYPKYLIFTVKYMSLIIMTVVFMGVLNGFMRQKLLLTTTDFYFLFLFWYKHHLIHNCLCMWNLILIIYVNILKLFVRRTFCIREAEGKITFGLNV